LNYFAARGFSVLCFSHDWVLLLTRKWLLEQIGAAVISVMEQPELKSKLLQLSPDIIILCQTLSSGECRRAVDLAERYCPFSRCVVLCSSNRRELSPRHRAVDPASRINSPDFLLFSVKSLLTELGEDQPS
jgi:hypothetical protein